MFFVVRQCLNKNLYVLLMIISNTYNLVMVWIVKIICEFGCVNLYCYMLVEYHANCLHDDGLHPALEYVSIHWDVPFFSFHYFLFCC